MGADGNDVALDTADVVLLMAHDAGGGVDRAEDVGEHERNDQWSSTAAATALVQLPSLTPCRQPSRDIGEVRRIVDRSGGSHGA